MRTACTDCRHYREVELLTERRWGITLQICDIDHQLALHQCPEYQARPRSPVHKYIERGEAPGKRPRRRTKDAASTVSDSANPAGTATV